MDRTGGDLRPRPWLPAVVVGAGVLLATLSILLAGWSKQLVKESLRFECAERAAALAVRIDAALDQRAWLVARGGPRPAEALAVWRLGADGAALEGEPPGAPAPAPALLEAARQAPPGELAPISARGPAGWLVATVAPLPPGEADGARAALVLWDPAALEAALLRPLLARGSEGAGARRFEALLLREEEDPPLRARALVALHPPLEAWRVAVALEDPEAARWTLRVQTALLFAVAAWLLLLLAASVVAWMRRERAHALRLAAREQLLARAYHELQTPLMLLRGAAESLERGVIDDPDEVRRCVGIVAREEERLTRSIRRLLRWLRAEGGGDAALASVREEVEAAAREQEPALSARGVRLELALDGAAAGLRAPRDLVADVVRELLVNVEKHARGATRVRVSLLAGPRGTAQVVVEDDGPGWPASDAGAPAPASGFGLGLLREGLLLCDGALRLEGRPGARGARAVVELAARPGVRAGGEAERG
ncbi:MAG: HAMP domain-containing histidine kinase [Planctomycetes bacterium]|nr:HAMP domain-containing histidine kinase [Planctomycetota bacterium]